MTSAKLIAIRRVLCPLVKFFPATSAGGPELIQAVGAPYAHTALRLIPLGGIGEKNMTAYLALPIVAAVGGSWLTDRKLAAAGQWDAIAEITRRALQLAASANSL